MFGFTVAQWLCIAWAALGHVALAFWIISQLHATPIHKWVMRLFSGVVVALTICLPAVYAVQFWSAGFGPLDWWAGAAYEKLLAAYFVLCCILPAGPGVAWAMRGLFRRPPAALRESNAELVDLKHRLGGHPVSGASQRMLARMPGNQTFELEVSEKHLQLDRLPPELEGLSIAHLSDLHFTGRLELPYFDEIVDQTNRLRADLIAVTGDIVDRPHCIEWLSGTLGRLEAPLGVYFILGNHDLRVDAIEVRRRLIEAGLTDLGGRWIEMGTGSGRVLLAGNEMPWIVPAADLSNAPLRPTHGGPTRILLAHTPDQFNWARRHDFDLMLAGHNHGGQFQLPWVGPVAAPSRHGVKYAAGTFHKRPTVMHVSRGVSSILPLRLNCRPEITRLVLRQTTFDRAQRGRQRPIHSARA